MLKVLVTALIATLTFVCAGCDALDGDTKSKEPAQKEPDRVVGVTIACSYTVSERDSQGRLRTIDREGTGEYCDPPTSHVVGATVVLVVTNVRAIVTVRTPAGGSYTVENKNTNVKVGDSWPK